MPQKLYDPKCDDLAHHFGDPEKLTEDEHKDLAWTIQQAIDQWFDAREYADRDAADRFHADPHRHE